MKYVVKTPSGKYVLPTIGHPTVKTPYVYDYLAGQSEAVESYTTYSRIIGVCSIKLCDDKGNVLPARTDILPVGCLFDGNAGFAHNARRIIMLAWEYGRTPGDFEWLGDNVSDMWEVDDAIEYLNGFVPDNCVAEWHDGDFIVSSLNNDDDEI